MRILEAWDKAMIADKPGHAPARLVAVLGSPRRGGNSDTLAREFLKGAASRGATADIVIPTDLGIAPCDGDNQCFADGRCVIRDGMNDIYERVLVSGLLLIATPVYFMGPPGSLKCFIDRFQAVWARANVIKHKPPAGGPHKAFAIFVGATADKNSNIYRPAVSIIKAFVNVIGFAYSGEIIAAGLDSPGEAGGREDLLREARSAGEAFAG